MGNLWLLIAAPATVLAAILFWRVFDIQHADYEMHRAEVREERAQFNADFANAFSGVTDPKLVAAADEAAAKRKKLETEAEERKQKALAEGKAQADKLDSMLNFPMTNKQQEK